MKFKNNIIGKFVLGLVFSIFMLVVSLVMMLVVIPVVLVPMGVALVSPTAASIVGGFVSLVLLLFSFFVVGWAVFYFYKKNTFVYKRR